MPAAPQPSLADKQTTPAGISREQAPVLLALLTIAGAWLRLAHLGSKSLWLDEGATVALARASWQHFSWVWWHGEANLQTIYFLLMRAWIYLGDSEAWLRLPSALFGIASIPVMYVLARKFMGAAPSLAAAALLAFSPTHVYYSQETRSYTLAILLVLLSTYFFLRAVEQNQPRDWLLWTLCGTLAFYSHDFAALVLVAQAMSLFFKSPPVPWRRLMVCGSMIFVAAVPGLTYVFRASPENLHFLWMPRPSAKEFWHLAMFFGGGGVKAVVAVILWLAGVGAVRRLRHCGTSDVFWRGMLVLLWAALPALILALISLRQPMFLQRYLIFSLPATILLATLGMDILRKGRIGLLLVVLLCGMSVPAIIGEYRKPREDWRAANNAVLTSAAPGDAVVFFPFYSRIMLDYYRDRYGAAPPPLHVFAPAYYDGGEDVRDLLKALDSDTHRFHHVWVLMAADGANFSNFDDGAAVAEKLQSIYGAPAVQKFAGIEVLEYGGSAGL
ncbi:MAG: glycosyltransferase family 39 protein [Candidatus Korobacteraceae bacterium]